MILGGFGYLRAPIYSGNRGGVGHVLLDIRCIADILHVHKLDSGFVVSQCLYPKGAFSLATKTDAPGGCKNVWFTELSTGYGTVVGVYTSRERVSHVGNLPTVRMPQIFRSRYWAYCWLLEHVAGGLDTAEW